MPSAKITYDPEMRQSDHGRRLYTYWRKVRPDTDSPEFLEYPKFFKWAMANGYTVGAKLFKYEPDEPYSPENSFWVARKDWVIGDVEVYRNMARERKWDETINRIRLHFGMEPIYSSEV